MQESEGTISDQGKFFKAEEDGLDEQILIKKTRLKKRHSMISLFEVADIENEKFKSEDSDEKHLEKKSEDYLKNGEQPDKPIYQINGVIINVKKLLDELKWHNLWSKKTWTMIGTVYIIGQ